MPISINSDTSQFSIQKNLNDAKRGQNQSISRIASGLRINSAKDDAAALAIATRLVSQVQGLSQAERNANDAISFAQVAEGGLSQARDQLLRARELAVQSANGTNTTDQRQALQAEVNQIQQQITDIANTTSFNGQNVLDGSASSVSIQVGTSADDTVNLGVSDISNVADGLDVSTAAGAQDAITKIDEALSQINSEQAKLGAVQGRFSSTAASLSQNQENTEATRSRIQDADIAKEAAELIKSNLLAEVGVALSAQANISKQVVLGLLSE